MCLHPYTFIPCSFTDYSIIGEEGINFTVFLNSISEGSGVQVRKDKRSIQEVNERYKPERGTMYGEAA